MRDRWGARGPQRKGQMLCKLSHSLYFHLSMCLLNIYYGLVTALDFGSTIVDRQGPSSRVVYMPYKQILLGGQGINEQVGINIYTLLYLKEITKKDPLYSTGNYIQHFVITDKRKKI